MTEDEVLLRHNVLRNALYHQARRRWFEAWSRWLNFVVVLLGTAAAGALAASFPGGVAGLGVATALVGAAQLAFDFSGKARDHQVLQRDYYDLLARIEAVTDAGPEALAAWRGDMIRLAAGEPPTLRAVDAKAFNDALGALEFYPEGERLIVPWWHRPFAHLLTFDGHRYDKLSEKARAGQAAA